MDRLTALQLLRAHRPTLAERFGVVRLALFGSTARDTARPDSDVDVLVAFDGPRCHRHLTATFASIWRTWRSFCDRVLGYLASPLTD